MVVPAAAAAVAAASLLVATGTLWSLRRLRRHHQELAASWEEQQRQLQRIAEQSRDQAREVERRGQTALAERFAAAAAVGERRDDVRAALDELLAAAAVGRLDAQPAVVLAAHLHEIDRELRAAATR